MPKLNDAVLRCRLPASMKAEWEREAAAQNQSLSDWLREMVEAGRRSGALDARERRNTGVFQDLAMLLQQAGSEGVYEVTLRTKPRQQG